MKEVSVAERKQSKIGKWFRSRKGQQIWISILFMAVPLFLLFLFTYFPFAEMVKFSFFKMKYATPADKRIFVGWQNYRDVFSRKDCFGALKLSLYYVAGALLQLVIALYLATVLSFKVKGGNFFKGLMFFPYLINGIAIGFIFKFFYTRGFVFDTVLQWCGFDLKNLPYWLKDQRINNWSLVATSIWRYCGQNMVLFIGAIMSVDDTLYEAAELDGANKWKIFKHVILPSIRTIVTLNIILSITGSLSAFEQPFVITGGANGTGTYFVVMNQIAHTSQKVGLASAMAVVLLMIIFACTILQKLFFKFVFRDADSEDESYKAKKARKKAMKQAAAAAGGTRMLSGDAKRGTGTADIGVADENGVPAKQVCAGGGV
jgi:multiple sugar transport system permease protein